MAGQDHRTLEQLEKDVWGPPEYPSHVVTTCHALRKKPLRDFSVEDLRIMIGQGIGLAHLLPKALDILEETPLAEGDFFPGDLLDAVLRADASAFNKSAKARLRRICETAQGIEPLLAEVERSRAPGSIASVII